jgi:hypothetical protein
LLKRLGDILANEKSVTNNIEAASSTDDALRLKLWEENLQQKTPRPRNIIQSQEPRPYHIIIKQLCNIKMAVDKVVEVV